VAIFFPLNIISEKANDGMFCFTPDFEFSKTLTADTNLVNPKHGVQPSCDVRSQNESYSIYIFAPSLITVANCAHTHGLHQYHIIMLCHFAKLSGRSPVWGSIGGGTAATFRVATTAPPSIRRYKSGAVDTMHLASWQKGCWMTYLSNGLGADNLFRSIDTNNDSRISKHELQIFFNSVGYKGVHPRAFKMLHELAHDHLLTGQEFKSWLILATKFGAEKNSLFALEYNTKYPEVGERMPNQVEGEEYHSWNASTMSQSIRRMQYAVRGQIVMRADEVRTSARNTKGVFVTFDHDRVSLSLMIDSI
jgi:hypothetical protein